MQQENNALYKQSEMTIDYMKYLPYLHYSSCFWTAYSELPVPVVLSCLVISYVSEEL